MPAYSISANLAASGAVATNFAAAMASLAAFGVRGGVTGTVAQNGHATANFTTGAAITTRATQMYSLLQTTLASQNDAVEVLAYLIAVTCASRCAKKYQAIELIAQVDEIATLALDEIFGLRPMPLHRPDNDQVNELTRAAGVVRSNAGLDPLPKLS